MITEEANLGMGPADLRTKLHRGLDNQQESRLAQESGHKVPGHQPRRPKQMSPPGRSFQARKRPGGLGDEEDRGRAPVSGSKFRAAR
jgi:hypothetical protein